MVQAVEALPQVQAQLDCVNDINIKLADTISQRDAHIKDLQAELDSLLASLKRTEASRDDAELRFLELDERFGKLASAVTSAHSYVAMADAVAEPQPQVEVTPVAEVAGEAHTTSAEAHTEGQSATDPTRDAQPDPTAMRTDGDSFQSAPGMIASASGLVLGEGVSVPTDPTVSASEQASVSSAASEPTTASIPQGQPDEVTLPLPLPAPTPTSTPEVAASANGSASPSADVGGALYTGKVYSEVVAGDNSHHMSEAAWIEGGGTVADYWR
jgi:hypothetical protein